MYPEKGYLVLSKDGSHYHLHPKCLFDHYKMFATAAKVGKTKEDFQKYPTPHFDLTLGEGEILKALGIKENIREHHVRGVF